MLKLLMRTRKKRERIENKIFIFLFLVILKCIVSKKHNLKKLLELVLRQCIFIILNIYAVSKILGGQFYMNGKLPAEIANTTLGEASSFSLAWTFILLHIICWHSPTGRCLVFIMEQNKAIRCSNIDSYNGQYNFIRHNFS